MRAGIDFGTTRTVVAAVDRGNYPVVSFEAPDGSAHDWFPSLVAVRGEQRVYGWEAWIREHRVIVSEGIATLGGDDFDHVLAEMAVGADVYASLSQSETFRIEEECRVKKEALHPNTRKIVLDLDAVREGLGTISIPIAD